MSLPSVMSTRVLVIFCGQEHSCLTEPVQLGTDFYSLMDVKGLQKVWCPKSNGPSDRKEQDRVPGEGSDFSLTENFGSPLTQ